MNSKKKDIIITVVSILTIFMALVGVTFSYFTTSMNGSGVGTSITTAKVGNITFDGGNDLVNASDIVPGDSFDKTFSISVPATDVNRTVYIRMDYTNEFKDLEWSITGSGANTSVVTGKIPTTSSTSTVLLVTKTIEKSSVSQTFNYTLKITLPNLSTNQDYDQNKKFKATLYADLGTGVDMIYYNDSNKSGTTTKPSGN